MCMTGWLSRSRSQSCWNPSSRSMVGVGAILLGVAILKKLRIPTGTLTRECNNNLLLPVLMVGCFFSSSQCTDPLLWVTSQGKQKRFREIRMFTSFEKSTSFQKVAFFCETDIQSKEKIGNSQFRIQFLIVNSSLEKSYILALLIVDVDIKWAILSRN